MGTVASALRLAKYGDAGFGIMSKGEHYRELADECLNLANSIDSREARALLLRMAEAWLRLADRERATAPQRRQVRAKVKECD